MKLRYKHIEFALADVMRTKPRNMGAFRARLRHLRNIGVPRLPHSGSGQPIEYSRRHALELLVALELEKVGQAPKQVALLAGSIVGQLPDSEYEEGDYYAVISESKPGYEMAFGLRVFLELMESAPDVFLVINVSACMRKLEPALTRALAMD